MNETLFNSKSTYIVQAEATKLSNKFIQATASESWLHVEICNGNNKKRKVRLMIASLSFHDMATETVTVMFNLKLTYLRILSIAPSPPFKLKCHHKPSHRKCSFSNHTEFQKWKLKFSL